VIVFTVSGAASQLGPREADSEEILRAGLPRPRRT
jgi:hypothetical protein